MPSPFDGFTFQLATSAVAKPEWFDEVKKMAFDDEPDAFLGGDGFLGPTGAGDVGLGERAARLALAQKNASAAELRKKFTPEDVLSEVNGRRADAVTAQPPRHAFRVARPLTQAQEQEDGTVTEAESPTEQEQARIDETETLRQWAMDNDFYEALALGVRAMGCFRRAYLRPFVPRGRMQRRRFDADGQEMPADMQGPAAREEYYLDAEDPADALRHIFLEVVLPDKAALVEDPDSKRRAGVVKLGGGKSPSGETIKEAVEISFVDPDETSEGGAEGHQRTYANTVLAIVEQGSSGKVTEQNSVRIPLRGRPQLVEMKDYKLFLNATMRKLQKALNTANTERRIVNDDAGFPLRLLMGAMPPGEWVQGDDGSLEFKASQLNPKPGDIIHVGGEEVYDAEQRDSAGNPIVTGVTRPSAATFEAADSKHYAEESKDLRTAILRHARQLYVEISGDAMASGVSRQQARQDFLQDVMRVKGIVDRAGAAVLEMVWDLACHLAGEPARDYDLECQFDCRITMPEPTPGERTASLALLEDGVWSRARTMGFNGVDDVEAEIEEIESEREAEAAGRSVEEQQAEALEDDLLNL